MRSLAVALVAIALPAAAQQAPAGTVRADRAAVEILPARPNASEVRTPEGFIRVEGGPLGPGVGTFGVYRAGARVPPPPELLAVAARQEPAAEPARGPDRCRPERSRYLRRLFYMIGIDLEDPLGFLDGLAGPEGYSGAILFTPYGQLPAIDPIHPLGWDLELKSLARELAACQRRAPR